MAAHTGIAVGLDRGYPTTKLAKKTTEQAAEKPSKKRTVRVDST